MHIKMALFNRLHLVTITGKRDMRIPLLLTPDMCSALDVLLGVRDKYINADCDYLFATKAKNPLMGWTALKAVVKKVPDLENPSAITSTKMRKYTATMSQVNSYN